MTVFLSKSFDFADSELNSYFERLMRAAGVPFRTAEEYTGEPINIKIERILSECDFLVGIYVVRYVDPATNSTHTSEWLMGETYMAKGQGKKYIALVEEGVAHLAGLSSETELIYFNRNDLKSMEEATVKFIQALRWHKLIKGGGDA